MKNNCEIVNNTFCKKCFEHHKQITGQKPINCAFKAFDNEYCDEVQELADYITNLQTQLNHQKAMWNELKEFFLEEHRDEEMDTDYIITKYAGEIADYLLDQIKQLEERK